MDVVPSGQTRDARVECIDLAAPLSNANRRAILRALGQQGVLCFPNRTFKTPASARRFSDFEVNVANLFHDPDFPGVMILSNQMRPDGTQAGFNDAGQGWHTGMSYSRDIVLANVLHARKVPVSDSTIFYS